jgi:hypothetical protein
VTSPLSTTIRVVRLSPLCPDEAIDADAMTADVVDGRNALLRYLQSRDESLLRVREGMAPTWFVVRRLPASYLAAVLDAVQPVAARRVMALRAAVHAVEGPEAVAVLPPGGRGVYVASQADYGVTLAPEEWVQEIADRYGADAVQELGEIALTLSRLPKAARGPFGWWGGTAATS